MATSCMQHAQKLVKFGHVVFEICEWTDKQISSMCFDNSDRQTCRQKQIHIGLLITILSTPVSIRSVAIIYGFDCALLYT